MVVATFLGALASGSIQALTTALAGDLSARRYHVSNLGILYTAGDLGSAIGPLAAYALLPIDGLSIVYSGSAVLMLVVAVWTGVIAARGAPVMVDRLGKKLTGREGVI